MAALARLFLRLQPCGLFRLLSHEPAPCMLHMLRLLHMLLQLQPGHPADRQRDLQGVEGHPGSRHGRLLLRPAGGCCAPATCSIAICSVAAPARWRNLVAIGALTQQWSCTTAF